MNRTASLRLRTGLRLALLGLLVSTGCATIPMAPTEKDEGPHLMFWRVQPDGGKATLYVLGSVHVGGDDGGALDQAIVEVVGEADHIWMELDTERRQPEVQQLMAERGMNAEGETLESQLPEEVWAKAKQAAEVVGLPEARLQMMRPWTAALSLSVLGAMKNGFAPSDGIETRVRRYRLAGEKPLEIRELETAEEQLKIFDEIEPEFQAELVKEAAADVIAGRAPAKDLYAAWKAGDVKALAEQLQGLGEDGDPRERKLMNRLYGDRNRTMYERLTPALEEGGVHLVVVGAAHTVGRGALIDRFLSAGYAVTRLAAKGPAPAPAPPAPEVRWMTLLDPSGRFRIDLPVGAKHEALETPTPQGVPLPVETWTGKTPLGEYGLVVTPAPFDITDVERREAVYQGAVAGMAQSLGEMQVEPTTLAGLPGVRVTAEAPGQTVRFLLVADGANLFNLFFASKNFAAWEAEMTRAEASLTLTGPVEPEASETPETPEASETP